MIETVLVEVVVLMQMKQARGSGMIGNITEAARVLAEGLRTYYVHNGPSCEFSGVSEISSVRLVGEKK